MQDINHTHEQDPAAAPSAPKSNRGLIALFVLLVLILLLTFIPPLLNVSRFKQRIASNIGASLGRPVHFDRLSLSLLPLPGFTLERFVVEEDPAFGSEPMLRADTVRATVRLISLFSSHVEFSKISLTEPSLNLVRNADGHWNLESVLLHASRIQAAPTVQRHAGPAPRFPYIEATGARVNLKLDREKTPYSLTDADLALWLPEPHQWHFRLEARPTRTDTIPADTGSLRLEGTLGNANAPATDLARVPINLQGSWQDVQLTGLSRLVLGRDSGLRGDLTLDIKVAGELNNAAIATNLKLARVRRADFVPPHLFSLEAACQATAENVFHAFSGIECHWPPADSSSPSVAILSANIPDTRRMALSSADVTLPALPAATLLDWLRVATPHPPTGLAGPGTLAGTLAWRPAAKSPDPIWSGELAFSRESLLLPGLGPDPIPLGDILLRPAPPPAAQPNIHGSAAPPQPPGSFDLLPIALALGGHQPATLEGRFDAIGYTLHLTGTAIPSRLLALADAIPQFGDGLRPLFEDDPTATPTHFDLTASRIWGGPQIWRQTTPLPTHHK